jgi:hypothetical protein
MGEELRVEGGVSLKDSVDMVENKYAHLHVGYRNPIDTPYTALMEIICVIFNERYVEDRLVAGEIIWEL